MKTALILLVLAVTASLTAQQHPTQLVSPFSKSLERAYLSLQSSLANDDLNGAHESALLYIAAFEKSTARLNVEALTLHAEAIAQASSIDTARASFKELSTQAAMLFDYLAGADSSPLYLVHCGMAFDGQGADWIQSSQDMANPYYGSAMLKCGSVVRRIGAAQSTSSNNSGACCATGNKSAEECQHPQTQACCSQ